MISSWSFSATWKPWVARRGTASGDLRGWEEATDEALKGARWAPAASCGTASNGDGLCSWLITWAASTVRMEDGEEAAIEAATDDGVQPPSAQPRTNRPLAQTTLGPKPAGEEFVAKLKRPCEQDPAAQLLM